MNDKNSIPWSVVLISAIGYFVDLFDTFLLPALRVPILRDLGVSDAHSFATYTTVFNWQLAGMSLGALFLWGPFADNRGRRKILLGSIVVYSLANCLTAAVHSVEALTAARFIAGIGLGGELGAGVTLVAESMARSKRGIGTMIIGAVGMLGVVVAALLAKTGLHWRTDFVIGGVLGIAVLALRIGVGESNLFEKNRAAEQTPTYWQTLRLLVKWPNWAKYIACILVGTPTFFVTGLLVPGAPEFGKAYGMEIMPTPATALIYTYVSIAFGDVLCGLLSQALSSRKKALLVFHLITATGIGLLVFSPPTTPEGFYWRCAVAGLGIGFWANMVTNAAEQFGTNVRATVAITVPNFVRFLLYPISAAFLNLKPIMGPIQAAAVVGVTCCILAIGAVLSLKDGFKVNLDYNE